ncbi:hypothetical protein AAW51_0373 [Caldimonas brevitalea]|uniref:Uncharacterized protein n=1 Tax=Caldimonas brevitalea TaxID=413882 RepID=A0A0G3BCH0_9BURK|nr:hypothetical protein AAW51_0373 [Caldimonas brevitalea]
MALACPSATHARVDAEVDALKKCLSTFGGIGWKLPYRPHLSVSSCSSAGASYRAGGEAGPHRSTLELISDGLRLAPSPAHGSELADATFAQFQQAVFFHFDALFQRHGFRRVETELADDRGGRYVALARYARTDGGPLALTWQTRASNTWRITYDGGAAR